MPEKKRVLVCGSRTFPIDAQLGASVVDVMRDCGDVVFLTRTAKTGFDKFVAGVASLLGQPCVLYKGFGGASNFERDQTMVDDATEVLLFFSPDSLDIAADTGTQHVAEVALNKHKPIRAWSAHESKLIYAGEMP